VAADQPDATGERGGYKTRPTTHQESHHDHQFEGQQQRDHDHGAAAGAEQMTKASPACAFTAADGTPSQRVVVY
jgi:hypothetical protein